jgi:hypothetical protein
VLKILTSKPFAIKILQTLFANPAPRKPFRGRGGGGYLESNEILPRISPSIALENGNASQIISNKFPQARLEEAES